MSRWFEHQASAGDGWWRTAATAALVLALASPALAQGAATARAAGAAQATGLPPLLDRELFFGNPEITGAQISPDGQYIAFIKPYKDTRNIWVKKTGEPFDAARLVTAETKRPIPGYSGRATAASSSSCRTTPATRTTTSMR
jgi:hypothetical protein